MKKEILSKLLSKAVQLWLRSQVSHLNTLELTIHGTNQQLLSGEIPQVDLRATQAVYQDLHLSEVYLRGRNIKINLQQIFQGKPIKLLEPIALTGVLTLTAPDLQASLAAPLLASALSDLLQTLLASRDNLKIPRQIAWQQADISEGSLKLRGSYSVSSTSDRPAANHNSLDSQNLLDSQNSLSSSSNMKSEMTLEMKNVILKTGLTLAQPHQLCLTPLEIDFSTGQGAIALESFVLDLGQDVAIEELLVKEGQLICQGSLTVQP